MRLVNEDKFLTVQFIDDAAQKKYLDALVFWKQADIGDFIIVMNEFRKVAGKLIRAVESTDTLIATVQLDDSTENIPIVTVDGSEWQGFAIQKNFD